MKRNVIRVARNIAEYLAHSKDIMTSEKRAVKCWTMISGVRITDW